MGERDSVWERDCVGESGGRVSVWGSECVERESV